VMNDENDDAPWIDDPLWYCPGPGCDCIQRPDWVDGKPLCPECGTELEPEE